VSKTFDQHHDGDADLCRPLCDTGLWHPGEFNLALHFAGVASPETCCGNSDVPVYCVGAWHVLDSPGESLSSDVPHLGGDSDQGDLACGFGFSTCAGHRIGD